MKQGYDNLMNAVYTADKVASRNSNPFMDALPKYEEGEVQKYLSDSSQFFNPQWRTASSDFRIEIIETMRENFFVPRPCHTNLHTAIRQHLRARYEGMAFRDPLFYLPDRPGLVGNNYARNLGIFGTAGSGKSQGLRKIAELYPSIISHENYHGHHLTLKQVPFLRVVCGVKGGGKSLNMEIISAFNDLMGTTIYAEAATAVVAQRQINAMVKTAAIGVIIIDEIQNILEQGVYKEDTLATITRLNEKCGVPLILVGTETAKTAFESHDHSARRASGFSKWRAMHNDDEWKAWLRQVFQYHLTKIPISFEDYADIFFEYSGGIVDDVIALFTKSQELALTQNQEKVLLKDINEAMKDKLYLREKSLRAHKERRKKMTGPQKDKLHLAKSPEIQDPIPDLTKLGDFDGPA